MPIEWLKKSEARKTAVVYAKGLAMETPIGIGGVDELESILCKKVKCLVYKKGGKIIGFVSFYPKGKNGLMIDFICSIDLRRGIGSALLKRLALYAKKKKIKSIYSVIYSRDKRVQNFYFGNGFAIASEYVNKNGLTLQRIKSSPKAVLNEKD
jgi:L-amino acid N-acyltransferase YncA